MEKSRITTSLFFLFLAFLIPTQVTAQETLEELPTAQPDTFYKAKVIEIEKEETVDQYGLILNQQHIKTEVKSGSVKGLEISLINEFNPDQKGRQVSIGDNLILGKSTIGGEEQWYVSDIYRLNALWLALFFFAIITLIFARGRGIRAFIGLTVGFIVILSYLVPQILAGANPFVVGIVSVILLTCTALFIAHGFNIRTIIAFISTLFTLGLALLLSVLFVSMSRLTGLGTEEAFYLQFAGEQVINLRGLLLAGIIIGTLGVLDDITTAQTAAVQEISRANKSLRFADLYKRGLSVGREHIISLVNTLVLAYTGAALPLLLLFHIYPQPLWVTLNSEIIMEEVMRMLIGSSALILAVPLTTLLAAWVFGGGGKKCVPKFLMKYNNKIHSHSH